MSLIMKCILALMEPRLIFKLRQSAPGNPQRPFLAFCCKHQADFNCKPMKKCSTASNEFIVKAFRKVEKSHKARKYDPRVPAKSLKTHITIESVVKTRIRYTSKSLKSKYRYRIRCENANSLYQQSA